MMCGNPATVHFPLGCIVAVGNLIDCLPTADSPASWIGYPYIPVFQVYPKFMTPLEVSLGNYGPERYGWVFADICPLRTPLPYKGCQGLRNIPEADAQKIIGMLA